MAETSDEGEHDTLHECPRCDGKGAKASGQLIDTWGITAIGERECFLCVGLGVVAVTQAALWLLMTGQGRNEA